MRKKLQELKKTSNELRDIVSRLYTMDFTDDKLYLTKFNNYIHENEIIKEIINPYDNAYVDVNEFRLKNENQSYLQFNIPIKDSLHYQYILKYLYYLINQSKTDLRYEFAWYKMNKNYNEAIRTGIKDVIDPLYSFICRELFSQMEEIEDVLKEQQLKRSGDIFFGDVAKDGGVVKKSDRDFTDSSNHSINKSNGDIFQGNNNKKTTKQKFYQKEGFWIGVLSGVISSMITSGIIWGITELVKLF